MDSKKEISSYFLTLKIGNDLSQQNLTEDFQAFGINIKM